jgi:hypothetical protein
MMKKSTVCSAEARIWKKSILYQWLMSANPIQKGQPAAAAPNGVSSPPVLKEDRVEETDGLIERELPQNK